MCFTLQHGFPGIHHIKIIGVHLPAGNYIVNVNQAVFDDKFRMAEPSKPADLINNHHLKLQFEIRQKTRLMNVRKE